MSGGWRAVADAPGPSEAASADRLSVERIQLTNFRNYSTVALTTSERPVVLLGANGAGKTNLLEAVSLLAPGQGLRRVPFPLLARGGGGDWAVAARLRTPDGPLEIGTGLAANAATSDRVGRIVRINGAAQSGSGVLADYLEMIWLTPAMDGLFTGPASERRRFLDRLILCFDPSYRTRIGHFDRAMAQRNRLLADDVRDSRRFEGLERIMAETGTAIAAARREAVAQLAATIALRQGEAGDSPAPFPWAELRLDGALEQAVGERPAVDVEDGYARTLAEGRNRDRAAGRTLAGPHRSDFEVAHGAKAMPARHCSTGEQKALLIGLVLAHATLITQRRAGRAPILLLDEIAAHLDTERRAALFAEIRRLGTQAWLTGTDRSAFAALEAEADFLGVDEGQIRPLPRHV
jgi:DNA replication and repair protein RecF